MTRCIVAALVVAWMTAGCRPYTYQLLWPQGITAAQYKKDAYECRIETRTGSVYVSTGNAAADAGAAFISAREEHKTKTNYNDCMAIKGYELVKVPRGAGRITPRPEPIRTITPEEIEARKQ